MKSLTLKFSVFATLLALAFGVSLPFASAQQIPDSEQDWNFRVYLDGKEIGFHNFSLSGDTDDQVLVTEAEFDVKLLFITVYKYRHRNQETWRGNCLRSIDSQTNANGDRFSVSGQQLSGKFDIDADEKSQIPGNCVMSFAYWDPSFLEQQFLLNSQTGEYTEVDIEPVGEQSILVQGREIVADRYRVTAPGVELEVWYSKGQGEWLGLQSTTKEGRKIRYELV